MQEDAILVQKTLEGDEQAFHRLIMKYYAKIYALILSWIKNPEDAKDLVQEVFLEAYLDLGSLRHHEQFRSWLQQIARHQCQDWLRKEKNYIQLDENMVCETPLADETLILRETLAKVMKAIDELPKSESQLLKERYLDDASYDDLETRHGLSHSVLAMRLFRAKQHVREKIKLLSGVLALSWHDMAKKIFMGGIEAMKITAKVKFIAIGVAAVLILSGTGIVVWHYQQLSKEATSDSSINQTIQKASLTTNNEQFSANNKTISDDSTSKLSEKQNLDAKDANASGHITAPVANLSEIGNSNIDPKLAKKIEVYNKLSDLYPVYKEVTQLKEQTKQEVTDLANSIDREQIKDIIGRIYQVGGLDADLNGNRTRSITFYDKQERIITNNPYINEFLAKYNEKEDLITSLTNRESALLHEINDICPKEEFIRRIRIEGEPPRDEIGIISWIDGTIIGNIDEHGLAKWLGKELPLNRNTKYNDAKDFTQ